MRKIKIENWIEKSTDLDGTIVETETSILNLIKLMLNVPDEQGKGLTGLDQFRTFARLDGAFKVAEKSNILELTEGDWVYVKNKMEKNVPARWGMIPEAAQAIEDFMGAEKQEKKEEKKKDK